MEDPDVEGVDDGCTTPIPVEVAKRLKVATYSFGEGHDRDTRPSDIAEDIISLAEELADTKADIIAMQGVTRTITDILFRTMRSKGYAYTKFDNSGSREGVEYLFSKTPITKREHRLFVGSRQGRGVGLYHLDIGSPTNPIPVIVCTSQFEAGGSGGGLRKSQILELQSLFANVKRIIFAGDTNIPAWQSFDPPAGWSDAWREKGSSDTEKTTFADRMDRIYYKGLRCVEFDTVCETGCGLDDDGVARKGVVATFVEGE
jgi:endonuclease/exonuclease/phosphatase (EEP) superfamily protein YafD